MSSAKGMRAAGFFVYGAGIITLARGASTGWVFACGVLLLGWGSVRLGRML